MVVYLLTKGRSAVDPVECQSALLQLLHIWFLFDMKGWNYQHKLEFLRHLFRALVDIYYSLEEKTVEMCCRFWFPGCLIYQMIESIPGPPTILREDFWYWGCQWHIARWSVIWKYYPGQGHNQLLQCSNVTRSQASKVTSPEKGRLNRRQTLLIQLCGWILLNCFGLTPPHLIWKCYARCSWAPGDFERSSWNSDSICRVQDSNWCLHW